MNYCKNKMVRIIFMMAIIIAVDANMLFTVPVNAIAKKSTNEQYIKENKKEPPIIIIPGIMASNLYEDKECTKKIWSPEADLNPFSQTSLYKLGQNVDISKTLYVKSAINQVPLAKKDREGGFYGVYKILLNKLCTEFPNREVYFFSYDFRKSNMDAAKELKKLIDEKIKADSVDIIGHSMGCLVASNYAVLDKEKINKVISLGGPFEGTPKIIKCALDWAVVDPNWNPVDMLLGLCGLSKDVKCSFLSVGELFPTKNFLRDVGFATNVKKNLLYNYTKDINYNEYYKYCETIFGDSYKDIVKEQDMLNVNDTDILATLKNSYFAIGTNKKTIKSVVFQHGDNLKDLGVNSLKYENNGDGTVPLLSANMMNTLDQSKTAIVRYFDGLEHGQLITNNKCIQWMVDILRKGESNLGSRTISKSKSYAVIRVKSPVDVSISKDGEVLSSKENGQAATTSYGRLDTIGDTNEIKMIAIDTDNNYNIEFTANEDGEMDYSVEWYDENNKLKEQRSFTDVSVSKESKISTSIDEKSSTELCIDDNHDGISEKIISDYTER